MKNIVLCGHTGNVNRGCEAIVKSTCNLLQKKNLKVILTTHDYKNDEKIGIEEFDKVVQYTPITDVKKNNLIDYIYSEIQDKIFKNKYPLYKVIQNNILLEVNNNIALNVGGDTYCYKEKPYISYALSKYAKKNNIPCFLWGCSIEEKNIDKQMLEDLKRYTMIFPRETITYKTLLNKGIDEKKLFLMSDPAFSLQTEEIELPNEFNQKKIIGLNISPLVLELGNKNILEKNIENVVEYIIKETDYDIALIPHVFNGNMQDAKVNKEIFNKYEKTNRVINIVGEYNCKQLKYIISKCAILIAARTHASIAAYSTGVPTLVLGYSVKSKGIAMDLFGTYENYVVSAQQIKKENELLDAFKWIRINQENIKKTYAKILPEYINRSSKAIAIIEKYADERNSNL